MANLKPCSSVWTVGTFFLILNRHIVPVLNTWLESRRRDVPGSHYSKVTSMIWTPWLWLHVVISDDVSSRSNLLPNLIFTDSESKTIKNHHRIRLGRDDVLFMINWGNKWKRAQFEFFIMPLRRPAKCLFSNWATESYHTLIRSNVYPERHFGELTGRKESDFHSSHET